MFCVSCAKYTLVRESKVVIFLNHNPFKIDLFARFNLIFTKHLFASCNCSFIIIGLLEKQSPLIEFPPHHLKSTL